MAEVLGLALVYALYKQRKAAASSTTATSSTAANGAVPADQVPDVIIQNTLPGPGTTGPTTGSGTPTPVTPPPVTPPPVTPPTPPTRPTSYTAPGTDSGDINRIAMSFGLTEAQLIAANPQLKKMTVKVNGKTVKLIGSGQPIPGGTKLTIPPLPAKK